MERAEWLGLRRNGVGGSDAPIICGVSKWNTPFNLYLEKRGEAEEQRENEYMRWGHLLEPIIRERYQEVTGRKVSVPDGLVYHPDHSWMFFTPDGIADDRIVQIKTTSRSDGWGEPGTDDIPETYMIQVQHEMMVAQKPLADVPVLIGGSDFRIYEVPEDNELQNLIFEREQEFWDMVQKGIPPDPTSLNDVQTRFRSALAGLAIQASTEILDIVNELSALKASIKNTKETAEKAQALVMKHMGEADTLLIGQQVLCTWKQDEPGKQFVVDILKQKYPEIYEECLVDKKPTRRFLLK